MRESTDPNIKKSNNASQVSNPLYSYTYISTHIVYEYVYVFIYTNINIDMSVCVCVYNTLTIRFLGIWI